MGKLRWSNIALTMMMLGTLVITSFIVGPAIETRFFPVHGHFELVSVAAKDGNTVGQFKYEKRRECPAQGFAWFAGEFGATSRQVEVMPAERRSSVQPLGTHVTVPYVFVGTTPDQVRSSMRAEIYNRCHPFWLTRTEIYP